MEENEQYGRRLCLRVEGVPIVEKETSDEVLNMVKDLFKEAEIDIPDCVIDRAHRIGPLKSDRKPNEQVRSIIVRFSTFRYRTEFYLSRKKLKKASVRLDLTKRRLRWYITF